MSGATPITHPTPRGASPRRARRGDGIDPTGFAAGTAILTAEGAVLVEHLAPGDMAMLPGGAVARIKSISRRRPAPAISRAKHAAPVRLQPGALGDGLPTRQLTLAPGHGLLIGNVLVQAKDLIDNATIFQDHVAPAIDYFQIELTAPGILLAEGAAAECGQDPAVRELSSAPLCDAGPTLAAIRAGLAARRRRLGLAAVETRALSARTPGRALTPVHNASREVIFAVPAGANELLIATPTFIAADFDPASTDRRQLGIALAAITTDGQPRTPESLAISGLHPRAGGDPHAWTTGALRLKLPKNTSRVTLHIAARPKTWRFDPKQAPPAGSN